MQREGSSVRGRFYGVLSGMLAVMTTLTVLGWRLSGESAVLCVGLALSLCAAAALVVLMQMLAAQLQGFSDDLCARIETMLTGRTPPVLVEDESLFARISHHVAQLNDVQQSAGRKLANDRQALESLVSDIAHQVRQPLTNLQTISDTLFAQRVAVEERKVFLQHLRDETEKLNFLMQALVKTSHLETGLIVLDKHPAPLYETVAQALAASVTQAEKKNMTVTVDCDEAIVVNHDPRWTAEALANLVDNAVKYTPSGGHLAVTVHVWELYAEICVRDDGPGIPESEQAQIFARFYRGQAAKNTAGVGIGLYLAREIVTRQGGYIRLISAPGEGAAFSLMLPLWDKRP